MFYGQSKTDPINILLVEDDDGDAKAVMRAFTKAQIANPIIRAKDGAEALRMLQDNSRPIFQKPFICLIDINMPRMDGHEFVRALREDPRFRRIVAFMLTTSRLPSDIQTAFDNNVAGYIVKETAGADFLDLIGALNSYWRLSELPEPPHADD